MLGRFVASPGWQGRAAGLPVARALMERQAAERAALTALGFTADQWAGGTTADRRRAVSEYLQARGVTRDEANAWAAGVPEADLLVELAARIPTLPAPGGATGGGASTGGASTGGDTTGDAAALLSALGVTRAQWDAASTADRRHSVVALLEAKGASEADATAWVDSQTDDQLLTGTVAHIDAMTAPHGADGGAGGGATGGATDSPAVVALLTALGLTHAAWDALSVSDRRARISTLFVVRGESAADAATWLAGVSDGDLLVSAAAVLPSIGGPVVGAGKGSTDGGPVAAAPSKGGGALMLGFGALLLLLAK